MKNIHRLLSGFFSNRSPKLLAVVIVLFLLRTDAIGQTFEFPSVTYVDSLSLKSIVTTPGFDTITVTQGDYSSMTNATNSANFTIKSIMALTNFKVNVQSPNVVQKQKFTYMITYTTVGIDNPATGVYSAPTTPDTLVVSYDRDSLKLINDRSFTIAGKHHKFKISIQLVFEVTNPGTGPVYTQLFPANASSVPNFVGVYGEIQVQKFSKYPSLSMGTVSSVNNITTNGTVQLSWNSLSSIKPAGYEVEWTYVEPDDSLPTSSLKYDFRFNASRIFTNNTSFNIPIAQKEGYLVYRVRMVRPDLTNLLSRTYGAWTIGASQGTLGSVSYIPIATSSNDDLNWDMKMSFVEDGKYKQVMTYYDGLLKPKQIQTRFNSKPTQTVIAQNLYDYEGRAVINSLPIPVNGISKFGYVTNFLHPIGSSEYAKSTYDSFPDTTLCPPKELPIAPLDPAALSAKYFSPNNPDLTGKNAFIPDAQGYPLMRKIIAAENNEKLLFEGKAGYALQLGMDRQMEYLYGSPLQAELNRYFGQDVGKANYYRKKITTDSHDQDMFEITDDKDKLVASGLIGTPDTNVLALSVRNSPVNKVFRSNLLPVPNIRMDENWNNNGSYYVEADANYSFMYGINYKPFKPCPGNPNGLLPRIWYFYEVIDNCGNVKLTRSGALGGIGMTTAPSISYADSAGVFLKKGNHVWNKRSYITMDDLRASVNYFLENTGGCYKSLNDFVKEEFLKAKLPCPSGDPCSDMRLSMIKEMYPRAKYGQYAYYDSASKAYAGTRPNSIFSWTASGHQEAYLYQSDCITQDTVIVAGKKYNLKQLQPQQLINLFNDSIGAALLPLHPDYCKLLLCPVINNPYCQVLGAIKKAADATSISRYNLSDIANNDPLLTNGVVSAEELKKTETDSISIDLLAFQKTICGSEFGVIENACNNINIAKTQADIVSYPTYMQDEYYQNLIQLYTSNREKRLGVKLQQMGNSCGPCADKRLVNPSIDNSIGDDNDTTFLVKGIDSTMKNNGMPTSSFGTYFTSPGSITADSLGNLQNIDNSSYCTDMVDYITNTLATCNVPQSTLDALADTLTHRFCANHHSITSLSYDSLTSIMAQVGISTNDLCNAGLVDLRRVTRGSGDFVQLGMLHYSPAYYQDMKDFLQNNHILDSIANTHDTLSISLSLCDLHPFEQNIAKQLGATLTPMVCSPTLPVLLIKTAMSGAHAMKLSFVNGSQKLGYYIYPATGDQNALNATFGEPLITATSNYKLNSLFNLYGFDKLSQSFANRNTILLTFRGTQSSVQKDFAYFLSAFNEQSDYNLMEKDKKDYLNGVGCSEFIPMAKDVLAKALVLNIKAGHPYFDKYFTNMLNYQNSINFDFKNFYTAIQSCGLTDSVIIQKNIAHFRIKFPVSSTLSDVGYYIDTLKNRKVGVSDVQSYQLGSNKYLLLNVYDDSLNINQAKQIVQAKMPVGSVLEYLPYLHRDTVAQLFSSSFSPINTTALAAAFPGATISNTSISLYYFIPGYGTFTSAGNLITMVKTIAADYDYNHYVDSICRFVNNSAPMTPVFTHAESAVSAQYYDWQMTAWRNYVNGLGSSNHNQLVKKSKADQFQFLSASSGPYSFATSAFSYRNAKSPYYLNNLYIDHSPTSNTNYSYIALLLQQVENYNNSNYGEKTILRPVTPTSYMPNLNISGSQTRTYLCGDTSQFLVNHFGVNNDMINIFIQLPGYLPAPRKVYRIVNISKGFEKDSVTYVNLKLATPVGYPITDTIQCIAYTNKNLGATYTIPAAFLSSHSQLETLTGRFENCESRKIEEIYPIAKIHYEAYKDSARNLIVAQFRQHVIDSVKENFSIIGSDIKNGLTLYYYDMAGNLIKTVSPAGVNELSVAGAYDNDTINARRTRNEQGTPSLPAHSKVTRYRYNAQDKTIETITPDAGTVTSQYDLLGRPVISRDAKQAAAGTCTYFMYDNLSRVIETGVMKYISLTPSFFTSPGTVINNTLRNQPRWEVTATTYDTPSYKTVAPFNILPAQENLKNRVACTKYFESVAATVNASADMNYNNAEHYSYDINGNAKTLIHDLKDVVDPLLRFKRVDYEYDLYSGKVILVSYNRGYADQFYQKYAYDADNRIVDVRTSNNGIYWDRDAHYDYYDHGLLARTSIGEQRVQGMDYAYTINGWLKAINGMQNDPKADMGKDGDVGAVIPKDVFSQRVDYFTGDYKAIKDSNTFRQLPATPKSLYNGNIAAIATSLAPFDNLYSKYYYDPLQRIDRANYTEYNYNFTTSLLSSVNVPDYASDYKYDGDGNLLKLNRQGGDVSAAMNGGTPITQHNMDKFSYRYTPGTNRLRALSDSSSSTAYKIDVQQNTPDTSLSQYVYDANGNMTQDLIGGLTSIDWNKAGKVKSVVKLDGSRMYFSYDAAGNRLAKELVQYPSSSKMLKNKTIYVRDATGNMLAVYEDDKEYDLDRVDLIAISDHFLTAVAVDGVIPIVVTDALATQLCAAYVQDASNSLARLAMSIPALNDYAADPSLLQELVGSLQRADRLSFAKSIPDITAYALRPVDEGMVTPEKLAAYMQPILLSPAQDLDPFQRDFFITLKTKDEPLYFSTLQMLPIPEDEKAQFPNNPAMLETFRHLGVGEKMQMANMLAQSLTTEHMQTLPSMTDVVLSAYGNSNTYADFIQDVPTADFVFDQMKQDADKYIGYRYALQLPPDSIQAQFKNNAVLANILSQQQQEPDAVALSSILSQQFASVVSLASNSNQAATLVAGLKGVIAIDGAAIEGKLRPWYTITEILKTQNLHLAEHHIYGSSRLGMQKYLPGEIKYQFGAGTSTSASVNNLTSTKPWYSLWGNDLFNFNVYTSDLKTATMSISGMGISTHILGNRHYELTNHLGNVQSTILDRATPTIAGSPAAVTGYKADISNAWDYYPFGMYMPGRYISDTAKKCVTINTTVLVPKVTKVWHDVLVPYSVVPYYWADPGIVAVHKLPKATSFSVEPLYVYHYNPAEDHTNGTVVSAAMGQDGVEYTIDLTGEPSGLTAFMQIPADTNVDGQQFGFSIDLDPDYKVEMRVRQYKDSSEEYYEAVGWRTLQASGAQALYLNADKAAIKAGGNTLLELRFTTLAGNFPAKEATLYSPWTYVTTYVPETRVATICDEKENYRFGFNGKEKDNELKGIGNSLDYGYRMEDTRIARFMSVDPLASKYPMLTPYQFASNTPIRAVDLDGLEAASISYGYRVTAIIVTGSVGVGAVVDYKGNVKVFTQWSAGVAIGAYAGGGATVSVYPRATSDQIMGQGVSAGGNVGLPGVSFGIDLNVSPQQNSSGEYNDFKMGVTGGIKPGSLGPGGAEVHLDYSEATPFAEFNIYNMPQNMATQLADAADITPEQANNLLGYIKDVGTGLQQFAPTENQQTQPQQQQQKAPASKGTPSGGQKKPEQKKAAPSGQQPAPKQSVSAGTSKG